MLTLSTRICYFEIFNALGTTPVQKATKKISPFWQALDPNTVLPASSCLMRNMLTLLLANWKSIHHPDQPSGQFLTVWQWEYKTNCIREQVCIISLQVIVIVSYGNREVAWNGLDPVSNKFSCWIRLFAWLLIRKTVCKIAKSVSAWQAITPRTSTPVHCRTLA